MIQTEKALLKYSMKLSKRQQFLSPEVFKIELAGTLSRRFKRDDVLSFIEDVMSKIRLSENPNELAFQIALDTGCGAIDSYFIATAKLAQFRSRNKRQDNG